MGIIEKVMEQIPSVNLEIVGGILVVVVGTILFKKLVSSFIQKAGKQAKIRKLLINQITKIFGYLIYGLAFLIILGILGVNLSVLAASAGVVGIAVGFASKDLISNLISGVLILFERIYRIGDIIQVNGVSGEVKLIKLRSTEIETFDGNIISIPNSTIASSKVINMTSGSKLMLTSAFAKVGYEEDLEEIKKLMKKAVKEVKGVHIDKGVKFKSEDIGPKVQGLRLNMYFYVNANEEPWIQSRAQERIIKELVDYRKRLGKKPLAEF